MFKRIFRRTYRRYRRLMLVVVSLYLMTCVILLSALQDFGGHFRPFTMFVKIYDPFGSKTDRQCSLRHLAATERQTYIGTQQDGTKASLCYVSNEGHVDIQMEDEWDAVSVGYPNLILTVTGWVDTIKVESWTPKPLRVIVMPHSHQDPGWISTVDSYYASNTRPTLNLIVDKLTANPTWKFIWTEIIFLDMWWSTSSEKQKEQFKRLLGNGQLELLTGGWVMPDEATTHYAAMLDQLMEGQLWINKTLNVRPRNSWAVDPFGHSSTMSYLVGQAGIQNMVINRVHFAMKRRFATSRNFEFYWKQQWEKPDDTGVFCHMMPFMLYSIPHSCGPDRYVCCKFDFHQKQCFYGNKHVDQIHITDENVARLAMELWEQLQKKSELYRNDVILMPHGDDFRYSSTKEWDTQFNNLKKLMDYINTNKELDMKIEFGTLADYFKALHDTKGPKHVKYPTLKGDFLPYSDRGDQYWSGIYTSRPFYKHMTRKLQSFIRSAEVFFTLSLSKLSINTSMTGLYTKLESARRSLGLLQHHDAITGTSRKQVVLDYGRRLHEALRNAEEVRQLSVQSILNHGVRPTATKHRVFMNLTETQSSYNKLTENILLETPVTIVVSNQLWQRRHEIVHVTINTSNVHVVDRAMSRVKHQISPVWIASNKIDDSRFLLSFEVDVEPLSHSAFTVTKQESSFNGNGLAEITNVTKDRSLGIRKARPVVLIIDNRDVHISLAVVELVRNENIVLESSSLHMIDTGPFRVLPVTKPALEYSNSYFTATFSTCDGTLKRLRYHNSNKEYKSDLHFVTYSTDIQTHPFRDKSGAYIFLPDGVAKELRQENPFIFVIHGNLFTQIRTTYNGIIHTATIYHITGPYGMGVHIDNEVNINAKNWNNKELAMRLETDVIDGTHSICTDLNGFQMHRRKTRTKMHIQGNFFPMTSVALVEDDTDRVTLITTETHAVASLVSGWFDVILDRRLMQDDWRGLNEGVTDNIPTKSSFFLVFESKHPIQKDKSNQYSCFPSIMSDVLTDSLNNRLSLLTTALPPPVSSPPDSFEVLTRPVSPCGIHIVNLRMLPLTDNAETKKALIVLHRKGVDCNVVNSQIDCQNKSVFSMTDLLPELRIVRVTETDITGVTEKHSLNITDTIEIEIMNIKTYKIEFR